MKIHVFLTQLTSCKARNNMREMKQGELAFFYHSNCKVPGIAGIMEIVQEASVDSKDFQLPVTGSLFANRMASSICP